MDEVITKCKQSAAYQAALTKSGAQALINMLEVVGGGINKNVPDFPGDKIKSFELLYVFKDKERCQVDGTIVVDEGEDEA